MKKLLCLIALVSSHALGMKEGIITCHLIDSVFLNSRPLGLSFNPQGNKLAAGLCNGQVAVVSFDGEKPTVDHTIVSEETVKSVNWSPYGDFLAYDFKVTPDKDKRRGVSIWNEKCLRKVKVPFHGNDNEICNIYDVVWNSSSDLLAVNLHYYKTLSNYDSNKIVVVSPDGKLKKELFAAGPKGFSVPIRLAWHPTEQRNNILAYTTNNIVYITDVSDDQPRAIWKFEKEKSDNGTKEIEKIAWSSDGTKLAVGINMGSSDGRIHILEPNLDGKGETKKLYEFKQNRMLMNFVWGPKDLLIADYTYRDNDHDYNVVFYDTKEGKLVKLMDANLCWANQLVFDKKNSLLVVGSSDSEKVHLYKIGFGAQEKVNILDQNKQ